jgi:predicted DNA-binding transcriptional regulator AlpA
LSVDRLNCGQAQHLDASRRRNILNEFGSPPENPGQYGRLFTPQVCKVTGLCRSMIDQLEAQWRIKIGLRAVGWIEGEVQECLAVRIALNRGSPLTRTT